MKSDVIEHVLCQSPIVPVLVIRDIKSAVPLAQTLVEAGIKVLEITLRTPAALTALEHIRQCVPEASVGVGTVTHKEQLQPCLDAGAQFIFTPGLNDSLLQAASNSINVPFIPGIASVSELMTARAYGFNVFKLFPAEAVGGIQWLNAVYGPFPEVKFCPTGGIGPQNYKDYLKLNNVICVGGSWIAPTKLIEEKDWRGIRALCINASI